MCGSFIVLSSPSNPWNWIFQGEEMQKFLLGSSKEDLLVCLMFYMQSERELNVFEVSWKSCMTKLGMSLCPWQAQNSASLGSKSLRLVCICMAHFECNTAAPSGSPKGQQHLGWSKVRMKKKKKKDRIVCLKHLQNVMKTVKIYRM